MADQGGLHQIGHGLWSWLAGRAGWGWSNAGLVVGDGTSLLVDTLFDLDLTRRMLAAMAPHTSGDPIATVVNTHANGDHCYGNGALPDAEVVASTATAAEMDEVPPRLLAAMVAGDLGDASLNEYVQEAFGPFHFDGIEVRHPTRTFDGRLDLDVAGRLVELWELGPAHTAGDVLVHVPDAATVFTGDLLFLGSTPIVWAGPVSNWIAACDRIVELEPSVVIPGHGPVTDVEGVRLVRDYLSLVEAEATHRFHDGLSVLDAARDIDVGPYREWSEAERLVVNVDAVYRQLDPTRPQTDALTLFSWMAELR